jgi:hypothetical protein
MRWSALETSISPVSMVLYGGISNFSLPKSSFTGEIATIFGGLNRVFLLYQRWCQHLSYIINVRVPVRYHNATLSISLDQARVSGSISCSGVPKDDNASEILDFLDCFSTLSRWKAILQEVVSAALVYDQSISTNEMLESESRYLTG